MDIRPAIPNQHDMRQLEAITKMAYASSPNYQSKVDWPKVRQAFLLAMHDKKQFIYVAEKNGVVVGVLFGGIGDEWYSKDEYAFEQMFYVKPGYSLAARSLMKAFVKWWQKFPKCKKLHVGNTSGRKYEEVNRFYQLMGFTAQGNAFCKFK